MPFNFSDTPLHNAAGAAKPSTVKTLIELGADRNAKNERNR